MEGVKGKKIIFVSLIILYFSGNLFSQNTWLQKSNFAGTPRQYAVGFTIGSNLYVGTGQDTLGSDSTFWQYNTLTDTWSQEANFGGAPRDCAVGFAVGNFGYIGLGFTSSGSVNDFWQYDIVGNSWGQKAPFPGLARQSAVGFSIGQFGYVGTGWDINNNYNNDFYQYDPSTDSWTKKADFGGSARADATAFSIASRGTGFIGTGYDGTSYYKDFWEYDPISDSWTQRADFGGSSRWRAAGFSIGKMGYIGTGNDNSGTHKDFWQYNPTKDLWNRVADLTGVDRMAAVGLAAMTNGYICTGTSNSRNLSDLWQYTPGLIFTDTLSVLTYCIKDTIKLNISFNIDTTFIVGNTFTAELSDSSGSFASPTIIGTLTDTSAGIINANIIPPVIPGIHYRIRVVSSNPALIGSDNGADISIGPQPIPGFSINDTVQCLNGNSYAFTDTSTIAAGGSISAYLWSFGDGSVSFSASPTYSYSTADTSPITVKLTIISFTGCMDSLKKYVYVRPSPVCSFSVNTQTQQITGNNFIFTNQTSISPLLPLSYKWNFGDTLGTSTATDTNYTYGKVDSFPVKLVASTNFGCKDSFTMNVYVVPDVKMKVDFSIGDSCQGNVFFINNTTVSGNDSISLTHWFYGDGIDAIIRKNHYHYYDSSGTFRVKLVVVSALGFIDSAFKTIHLRTRPVLNLTATPDSIINAGTFALLTASGSNFDSILWSNGHTSDTINVNKAGLYSVRVVDSNNCSNQKSITITIKGNPNQTTINLPTVITPNGDGYNDYWKINLDSFGKCQVKIYNRWDDELYSSSDYKNDWNGTYKGATLPQGAYYYVLKIGNGTVYKGVINIVR